MVDHGADQNARDDDRQDEAHAPEDLGDRLKKLSDKIGCAANAPLENFEKRKAD